MKQERVILSFVMVLIGLAFAAVLFYFYQSSKVIPQNKETAENITPTPTPAQSLFLSLEEPRDESIADRKTVVVKGKTDPNATVAILTVDGQIIVKPSSQGDFFTTITIDDGTNYIKVIAMAPNGDNAMVQRVVSYTTEDF